MALNLIQIEKFILLSSWINFGLLGILCLKGNSCPLRKFIRASIVYLEVKSHFNQQIQANSTSVNHRYSTINADDISCSPFRVKFNHDGLMVSRLNFLAKHRVEECCVITKVGWFGCLWTIWVNARLLMSRFGQFSFVLN
jgi:hypothetical protein